MFSDRFGLTGCLVFFWRVMLLYFWPLLLMLFLSFLLHYIFEKHYVDTFLLLFGWLTLLVYFFLPNLRAYFNPVSVMNALLFLIVLFIFVRKIDKNKINQFFSEAESGFKTGLFFPLLLVAVFYPFGDGDWLILTANFFINSLVCYVVLKICKNIK